MLVGVKKLITVLCISENGLGEGRGGNGGGGVGVERGWRGGGSCGSSVAGCIEGLITRNRAFLRLSRYSFGNNRPRRDGFHARASAPRSRRGTRLTRPRQSVEKKGGRFGCKSHRLQAAESFSFDQSSLPVRAAPSRTNVNLLRHSRTRLHKLLRPTCTCARPARARIAARCRRAFPR